MSNLPVLHPYGGLPTGLIPQTNYGMFAPGWSGAGPVVTSGPGIPMGGSEYSYLPAVLGGQSATAPLQLGPGSPGNLPSVTGPMYGPGIPMPSGPGPMYGPVAPEYGPFAPTQLATQAAPTATEGVAAAAPAAESVASKAGGLLPDLSLAEGLTLRSGLRAAGLPMLAGQAATYALNSALPSTGAAGDVRQTLSDAATWAGIGAGVGSIVPGIGTVAGGVGGGIAGGAYGLLDSLFGGSSSAPDYRATLTKSAQAMGLQPSNYTSVYDLYTESGMDKKQASALLAQQIVSDAQQQKVQAQANQQALEQRQLDQKFAMAMQSQAQQFFSPYVNNIITAGKAQSDLLQGLASQLPAPFRSVLEAQAASQFNNAQQLAGAYAAQSALIPGQFMAQAELKRQQQLQQLQYQQAMIQAQQGRSGAAGGGR